LGQLTSACKDFYNTHGAEFTCIRARGNKVMQTKLIVITATLLGLAGPAHAASLFVPGSTFEVQGASSPDSFTDTVDLAPGTYSLDNGALNLTISFVPAGGTDEWLVFSYAVPSGTLSSVGEDWSLNEVGLDAAVPVNFIRAYGEFLINGVSQTWSSSVFSGYTPMSSPVPGSTGTGAGTGFFVVPYPAGPIPSLGAFLSPFGFLNDTGIDAAAVTGWTQALEFRAQTPVPEASTWAMMLAGFAGLGLVGYRAQRKTSAFAA
jgi:hypothetical protein